MAGPPEPPRPLGAPQKKAQDFAAVRDWPGYFRVVQGKPPRETLILALEKFEAEGKRAGTAVDLGCGEGRDAAELLRRGWTVHAIDSHPAAFEYLRARVGQTERPRLITLQADFADATWPRVDLVNASFALPFCPPEDFGALWGRIVESLPRGGRFAGQLFGDRDTWAALPDRSHQTRAQAEALLRPFDVERFDEEEKDDNDARGVPKHWQVFHIVARKR